MIIRFPDQAKRGGVDDKLHSFIDIPPTILSLAGIEPPGYMHGRAFLGKYAAPAREYVFGGRNRMDREIDRAGYARDEHFRYIRNYFPGTPWYMDVEYREQMPMMQEMLRLLGEGQLDEVQRRWFEYLRPEEEFYDLARDPYELVNLAGEPEYSTDLERLRKAYNAWNEQYNALWELPEKETRAMFRPGGKQPVTQVPSIQFRNRKAYLASATPGTSIAYQVNGMGLHPDHWFLYKGPFRVHRGDSICAIAVRAGYRQSEIQAMVFKRNGR
jgi:hypothetical protein